MIQICFKMPEMTVTGDSNLNDFEAALLKGGVHFSGKEFCYVKTQINNQPALVFLHTDCNISYIREMTEKEMEEFRIAREERRRQLEAAKVRQQFGMGESKIMRPDMILSKKGGQG